MGDPTGFMQHARRLGKDRDPRERVADWKEFHLHLSDEELGTQGARCMDCGVPFCQTGDMLSGMATGCPIHNLIPEWNDLVYKGRWREALERLHKTNNFPEFTGRVCPAPCEGSCVLSINQPAVTIKSIECAIVDRGFAEGWIVAAPPSTRTGKCVAVIGSGPSGLACAAQLNRAGHKVTVYERDDRVGGLLMYGIPNPHLGKDVVDRRVALLREEGIEFVVNAEVGKNVDARKLVDEFDAVVLCCGATQPRDLDVPGRDASGVHFAMQFLRDNTKKLLDSNFKETGTICAKDTDVIVLGGGDTGTDCVATAMRHGCKSLLQFEILPQPPDTRAADNPWPQWPKVYKLDYGQEEALAKFGADPRRYQVLTKRIETDAGGKVRGITTVQIKWKTRDGKMTIEEQPNTEKFWQAQLVLLALGFLGPEQHLPTQLQLPTDPRSNIQADHDDYRTNNKKIFAAGDARRGQSLVVWAINEGRGAARECDRYLMGGTELP